MQHYRLFCLDGVGTFTTMHEIFAADDEAAIARAREMKLPVKCELWDRGRLVATIQPSTTARSAGEQDRQG